MVVSASDLKLYSLTPKFLQNSVALPCCFQCPLHSRRNILIPPCLSGLLISQVPAEDSAFHSFQSLASSTGSVVSASQVPVSPETQSFLLQTEVALFPPAQGQVLGLLGAVEETLV